MRLDLNGDRPAIAYFSMEIALTAPMPTYAGGLGVLAGDILRSAADLGLPTVGVTLAHRKGYFHQQLDRAGKQTESPHDWDPDKLLERIPCRVSVKVEDRDVQVQPWLFRIKGVNGHSVPVILLDTDVPENAAEDRVLTDQLYGGDLAYRMRQEVILGLGGIAALRALGLEDNLIYHLNEGHSALLALGLLEERLTAQQREELSDDDIEEVRAKCVFTTHTPVPAGHDQFPREMTTAILGERRSALLEESGCLLNGTLNMTFLGLRFSRYINGVSMRHGEVSLGMFPGYPVQAITNGVHAATWISASFAGLFDHYTPGWRHDNRYLRYAIKIPLHEIQAAHRKAKQEMLAQVSARTGIELRENVFTIGFARRATPYKRADLLLADPRRLREIAKHVGAIQVIYAGKAHPKDEGGKAVIGRIFEAASQLDKKVRVVYLKDYDMDLARYLISGTDLWLNTPRRPREASGTSGMKAACNGVPSLSTLDGWWVEGHIEGVTGWSIPHGHAAPDDDSAEMTALYDKLERVILPLYYGQPPGYAEVMRSAIAINASFFNTQRVVSQYMRNAYFVAED